MESRFTLKDFVFVIMFFLVIGAVLFGVRQFVYQESRLNDLKKEMQRANEEQKLQSLLLTQIRDTLRGGVHVSDGGGNSAGTEPAGRIRRKNPDGSVYVYYPEPPKPARDPEAQPDYARGDWLVQNLSSEPKVIAPYIEKDAVGQLVHEPVLEVLVVRNPETFEFEPNLAESYEQSADGLTFKFKLRKGVVFSDGVPMTIDDVIFSYHTIMDPGIDAAPLRGYFEHVKSCTKIDDRTVEFKMDEPYFLSLDYIGSGLPIIPEHIYKYKKPGDFNDRGDLLVGSGPYVVEKWDRGQQITLVRNNRYWGDRPTFDRVIFKFIENPQAAFQSFRDEQIDWFDPDPNQFVKSTKDPEFLKKFIAHKYQRPGSGYAFIGYNEAKPMFKDKVTRKALAMLLDRNAMAQTLLDGMATETSGNFSPISPQNDPAIKPLPYDPEAARKLLAQAGWKTNADGILERDGVRFEFDLSFGANQPVSERIANYVKEQFASAGIRMRITPWEFAIFTTRLDERNYDAAMLSWVNGGTEVEDDPFQIWHSKSIKDKGSNFINFVNKESDALIEEGRRTLDDQKRYAIWHKWQALIHEEQPYTFLYARMERVFINGRFRNTLPYKLAIVPYDWYVPAKLQKYR